MDDSDTISVLLMLKEHLRQFQIKQVFSKSLIKQIFLHKSKEDDFEAPSDSRSMRVVHTFVVEQQKKDDTEITDLICLIAIPFEGKKVCQLLYLIGTANKKEALMTVAFQKAKELGFNKIEASDLMGNFTVLAGDTFGFQ